MAQWKLLLCLCMSTMSMAWWCHGHMATAMVAQLDLLRDAGDKLARAQKAVSVLAGDLSHNLSDTFVESACWADDIKSYGLQASSTWHYIDLPYSMDGTSAPTDNEIENVVWAIKQGYSTMTGYKRDSAILETALMMRYLIHFVGDLHQPLHATTMFSSKFPSGDRGGNSFKVYFDSQISNLHALWDSVLGELEKDITRPASNSAIADLETFCNQLMSKYTRADLSADLSVTDWNQWAQGSFKLAEEYVYKGITPGTTPSDSYIQRGIEVANKQIVLGGYRLADLIRKIYNK